MTGAETESLRALLKQYGTAGVLQAMANMCEEEASEEERRHAEFSRALNAEEQAESAGGDWYETAAGRWRRERDILTEACGHLAGGRAAARSAEAP